MDELYSGLSEGMDELGGIFLLLLLLVGGLLVLVVWGLMKTGLAWIDEQAMLREAQTIFDRVRAEDLPDLQIDPLLRSIFGENIDLPADGEGDGYDWLYRVILEVV